MRRLIGAAIVAITLSVPVSVTTSSPAWDHGARPDQVHMDMA